MAYQTGSASDQTDLMSKLSTFAQANGFTQDYYNGTNRHLSLSRAADNVYVSFCWDAVSHIQMYQALGYSATHNEAPWNQANDSGNGTDQPDTYPDRERQVSAIGNGTFPTYHFFAYTNPYAIHIVLEFSAGLFRHFGFGKINKTGIWTGGAWCAGHLWNPGNSFSYYDIPYGSPHSVLTDGLLIPGGSYYGTYSINSGGTIHCEGLPNQVAAGKWGHCVYPSTTDVNVGNDRASNPRIRIAGGFRGGVALAQFGQFLPDLANGYVPIIPIEIFYYDSVLGEDGIYYLGRMPNVGHIHLEGIDASEEITIGADTWIAFPMVRKSNIDGNNQESENAGIIYKKVT